MKTKLTILAVYIVILFVDAKKGTRHRKERHRERVARYKENLGDTCSLSVSCPNDSSVPISLPIYGPKGPSGAPGERGKPGLNGKDGEPGLPGKDAEPTPKVAFFVGVKSNKGKLSRDMDLIAEHVVTNLGENYNEKTGRFVAPHDGTYMFTVVIAAQHRQRAAVKLVKNGAMIMTVWAESVPAWSTSTNNAILQLQKGDEAWLVHLKRAPYLYGFMYSTFSGYLIYPQ